MTSCGATEQGAADCWVLSDGKAGNEVQSLALAEALGRKIALKRVTAKRPWCWLPPSLWPAPLSAVQEADSLTAPWPEMVIGAGRLTAALTAEVRKRSGGASFAIQLQDSKLPASRFDLVVVPEHDRLRGENVLVSRGSLNKITPALLEAEALRVAPTLEALSGPRVAVLVGGSSRTHRMTTALAQQFAESLIQLCKNNGASLMVTLSRRTDAEAARVLRGALAELPAYVWDGRGPNPYFGFLGLADQILVTSDSVNMVSEAASTGKPVYLVDLEGGSPKFARFHESLIEAGLVRRFEGQLEVWQSQPLQATRHIAAQIQDRLAARRH